MKCTIHGQLDNVGRPTLNTIWEGHIWLPRSAVDCSNITPGARLRPNETTLLKDKNARTIVKATHDMKGGSSCSLCHSCGRVAVEPTQPARGCPSFARFRLLLKDIQHLIVRAGISKTQQERKPHSGDSLLRGSGRARLRVCIASPCWKRWLTGKHLGQAVIIP